MSTIPPLNAADGLLKSNNYIGPGLFTFSFPDSASDFLYGNESADPLFSGLNTAQQTAAKTALTYWGAYIIPDFVQLDDAVAQGQIRFAFTHYTDVVQYWGYTYVPPVNGTIQPSSGIADDIWINSDIKNSAFTPGGYDFNALLHEIGHALGLSHTFDASSYPAEWDTTRYSIMSYTDTNYLVRSFSFNSSGTFVASSKGVYPSTAMVLDIAAVQARYGAEPNTFAGDTTWTIVPNAPFIQALYDAGGIDTLDLSNHTRGSIVDLTPGAYSSIDFWSTAEQTAYWKAQFPGHDAFIDSWMTRANTYQFDNNWAIAFSTIIENATGGSGNDTITGNAVANNLIGGGGDDVLLAAAGDDTLQGGLGNDAFDGGDGVDTLIEPWALAAGGVVAYGAGLILGGEGIDYEQRIEVIKFTDGTVDRRDANPMIDDLYYYGQYHDVWLAHADADAHFLNGGWREGRNPNAFFDTKGYMAAHGADVNASGLDPLTHYLTIGWKQGFDPSKLFDTKAYLAAYSDVANSGVNPLYHYMFYGAFEGRSSFADSVLS